MHILRNREQEINEPEASLIEGIQKNKDLSGKPRTTEYTSNYGSRNPPKQGKGVAYGDQGDWKIMPGRDRRKVRLGTGTHKILYK